MTSKVKPLDLSYVMRHAFLSGVVAARNIPPGEECVGPTLWLDYDPHPNPAYDRILAAVEAPVQEPVAWRWESCRNSQGWDTCYGESEPAPDPYISDITPLYDRPRADETAALRAKLAEVERERDDAMALFHASDKAHKLTLADRDEERKLADKAVALLSRVHMEYPAERHVRDQLVARHAARRKE